MRSNDMTTETDTQGTVTAVDEAGFELVGKA